MFARGMQFEIARNGRRYRRNKDNAENIDGENLSEDPNGLVAIQSTIRVQASTSTGQIRLLESILCCVLNESRRYSYTRLT